MGFKRSIRDWFIASPLQSPVADISSSVSSAARLNLARELDLSGKQAEAASAYWSLIAAFPDDAGAYINLGDLWIRMGQPADARIVLVVASNKWPDVSPIWCNLSSALSELGEHEDAMRAAHEAVRSDPSNAMAYYNRAECWFAMNQARMGIHDFERAHELAPDNLEIAEKLSVARISCMDVKQEVAHNFGDAKHEPHAHGAMIVNGIEVGATMQCPHCSGHFLSVRGSGIQRMFCGPCGAVTCGATACNTCIPFQKAIDDYANLVEHQSSF